MLDAESSGLDDGLTVYLEGALVERRYELEVGVVLSSEELVVSNADGYSSGSDLFEVEELMDVCLGV